MMSLTVSPLYKMTIEQKGQIYKITNTLNNMSYIGQTVRYRKKQGVFVEFGYLKRFQEHKHNVKRVDASVLGKAMCEQGFENFTVELIEECDVDVLDHKEIQYIDLYNTLYPCGYNVLYGQPYTSNPDIKAKISTTLTQYFKDADVRKRYSEIHRNKFKEIRCDVEIKNVRIHPIRQDGEYKIVYAYIVYEDGSQQRRRYGGVQEEYQSALERCWYDVMVIVKYDISKVVVADGKRSCDVDLEGITKIAMRIHTMGVNKLVSVYVHSNGNNKKRYVFGGKTVSIAHAYIKAYDFVESITKNPKIVSISKSLKEVATLPN